MKQGGKVQVPWAEIDTLLLDMDGTLLDLAFDNFFWLELVPAEYAKVAGLDLPASREQILSRYGAVTGTLPWYCIDHWTGELGLDIEGLKRAHSHRIGYLPRAPEFLRFARAQCKRLILVTNAHRVTLTIKCERTGVDRLMDTVVSSHDYGVEKEQPAFWQQLVAEHDVRPARSLLIEDSLAVLAAAKNFGIGHAIAISRPDTTQARRVIDEFYEVEGVASLID
jgi:putative hydrolase of the HAD superfamily